MAAQITVIASENNKGWSCAVQVTEQDGQTRHSVTLTQKDFEKLATGKETTPEQLVKKSFEFLLEREPKNLIMRQFDLLAIAGHFPEYPTEIHKRL